MLHHKALRNQRFFIQPSDDVTQQRKMATRRTMEVIGVSLEKFSEFTRNPEIFLSRQDDVARRILKISKDLYDLSKAKEDESVDCGSLRELIIDGFDDEQIWQQMELRNAESVATFVNRLARLGCKKEENLTRDENAEDEDEEMDADDNDDQNIFESNEEEEEGDESVPETKSNQRKTKQKSIEGDRFFKWSELEKFLDAEDAEEGKPSKDDDMIDYFGNIPEDDDDDEEKFEEDEDGDKCRKKSKYSDFFNDDDDFDDYNSLPEDEDNNNPNQQPSSEDETRNEDDDENENETTSDSRLRKPETKSILEIRQERLKQKIEILEESNLAEKPWQLQGEATASNRPENSLLQEHALYEHTQRLAPTITEETTKTLEDIICQRIKEQIWNDVERKLKPKEEPFEYKKRIVLDQEKSKLGLAEVYEKEYLKNQQHEKVEQEIPEHREIKTMMTALFSKLDALSNFHFTPKPVAPDVKIVNNLPSVVVEEVAPVTASSASMLAPAEILPPSVEVKGDREKDKTDKLRERRIKKMKQRMRSKEKERKAKLGIGSKTKYNKDQMIRDLVKKVEKDKSGMKLSSSKHVFSKLEEIQGKQNHKKQIPVKKVKNYKR